MKTAEEILEQVYPLIKCSDTGWNISRNTVIEAMNIHSDQFKPKWISVDEHLPPFNESIITLTTGGVEFIGINELKGINDDNSLN